MNKQLPADFGLGLELVGPVAVLLAHQKSAATEQAVAVQLTYASVVLVNVAYLQPNADAIELATEIVNVANQRSFFDFSIF